jgi:hypothetical protein
MGSFKVIKQVGWRDDSPATKNGELKFNDILLVKENEEEYYYIFTNRNRFAKIQPNEKMLNELKMYTWTIEPDGKTIKSNSYITTQLNEILQKYDINYETLEGCIEDIMQIN